MPENLLVHMHIYYVDLFNQLADIVEGIDLPKKIVITYVDEKIDRNLFLQRFPDADIRLVDNVGYDIKPFVDVVNSVNLDDYAYVLKLHTKRNYDGSLINYCLDNGVRVGGTKWRDYLLEPFTKENWNETLKILRMDKVGAVGSINCLLSQKQDSTIDYKIMVKQFTNRLGLQYKPYSFFGGTMFIAKANLLKVLKNIPNMVSWMKSRENRDWVHDPAYIMERMLGEIIIAQNKRIVGTCKCMKQQKKSVLHYLKPVWIQKQTSDMNPGERSVRIRIFGLRVYKKVFKGKTGESFVFKKRLHSKINCGLLKEYGKWIEDIHNNKSLFVPITDKPFKRKKDTPKIFAYYLTQFHAIPENDDAHGKGFTEWTNVATATPQFVGHYQPKIPYDVGFYNLLDINVMKRQAELAKMYGIYGWCFYYYWFSGKKVLEKPLYNFLNSDIDLPFHLCWANENWSKLWDGGDKEVILEQDKKLDADAFFKDLLPFIKDKRYEKIDNKPLLMIYRPSMFNVDDFRKFIYRLDELAKQEGFDGMFCMSSNFEEINPGEYNLQGIIEFPPHGIGSYCLPMYHQKIYDNADFNVLSPSVYITNKIYQDKTNHLRFKACFPCWDNTPRKVYSGAYVLEITDDEFAQWLSGIITWTRNNNPKNMQYVYINAWNEWAEGAILEPTTRWGYRKLQTVKDCLEQNE